MRRKPAHPAVSCIVALALLLPSAMAQQDDAALYRKSKELMKQRRFQEAVVVLNKAMLISPQYARTSWRERSKCYAENGQYEKAIGDLDRLILGETKDCQLRACKALLLAFTAQNEKSLVELQESIIGGLKSHQPLLENGGDALAFNQNFYQTLARLAEGNVHDKTASHWFPQALANFLLGNYATCSKLCLHEIQSTKSYCAYILEGDSQLQQGHVAAALNNFHKAVELAPKQASGYKAISAAFLKTGKYEQSIDDIAKLKKGGKESAASLTVQAQILAANGLINRSMADLSNAISEDPRYADAYLMRAQLNQSQEHWTQAIADYTRLLSLSPELLNAKTGRAACYFEVEMYEKALSDLSSVLENACSSRLLYARAACYDKLGKHDLAYKDRKVAHLFGD